MKTLYILLLWIAAGITMGSAVPAGDGKTLQPGDASPGFKYPSVEGKMVSLKDFEGKYVYIDVWATWCSPCRQEIPHLKQLEKTFKKKKIVFVSISTDTNLRTWEQFIEKEQLGGVQLNVDGDKTFLDAYGIRGIPRFILLDKKGRVIQADMTRPSDPKTEEFLKNLKGI